jgi:hypothetical protein
MIQPDGAQLQAQIASFTPRLQLPAKQGVFVKVQWFSLTKFKRQAGVQ